MSRPPLLESARILTHSLLEQGLVGTRGDDTRDRLGAELYAFGAFG